MTGIGPEAARNQALARAAEAMLRAAGGCEISLLLPSGPAGDGTAQELGVKAGEWEEVAVGPAVVRLQNSKAGERQKFEIVIAAASLPWRADSDEAVSAEAMLASACGVVWRERRLRVETVSAEHFAGGPYLYRLVAWEQAG